MKVFKVSYKGFYGCTNQSIASHNQTFPIGLDYERFVVAESAIKAYELCDEDFCKVVSGVALSAPINTQRYTILEEIHLICDIDLMK